MNDGFPHVPAAFINEIAENGSKEEAVKWLQETYNELCYYRDTLIETQADLRRIVSWEDVDK